MARITSAGRVIKRELQFFVHFIAFFIDFGESQAYSRDL